MSEAPKSEQKKHKASKEAKGRRPSKQPRLVQQAMLSGDDIFGKTFLSEHIMDYLDIPSLVSFAATNQTLHNLLQPAVQRRKASFAQIESQIVELLQPIKPSRAAIQKALDLQQKARRLIDSGLGWLDHPYEFHDPSEDDEPEDEEGDYCPVCLKDPLFGEERMQLKAHSIAQLSQDGRMLPKIFYISEHNDADDAPEPTRQEIEAVGGFVVGIWGAEDHMQGVYELMAPRFWSNPDEPLLIFNHPLANFYSEMVYQGVERIVTVGKLEAFRVAAREYVLERENALPCLMYALTVADHLLEERSLQEEDGDREIL